jgi:hypothetical protein
MFFCLFEFSINNKSHVNEKSNLTYLTKDIIYNILKIKRQ